MRPADVGELVEIVAGAAASGGRLELRGGGSKAAVGAPREAAVVEMTGFAGVIDYDPAELVLTARAGTPLAEIEALVLSQGQMLAFEPFDHGPIFGRASGDATIGGVIAAGVSGSRRVSRGAARDHLLGFKAVSGRGEAFIGGAKVVKNVTGYDLPKLMTGSWGRLAALTEITLKVLPRPEVALTLVLEGLKPRAAQAAMSRAMGSQADVAAAGHSLGLTAFRLEGFGPSVTARHASLEALLADVGKVRVLEDAEAKTFWRGLRDLDMLQDGRPLWRVSTAPSRACQIIETLGPLGVRWLMDWAGGLIWLTFDGEPAVVRQAADAVGGHVMLLRAPEALRAVTPALPPQPPGVRALEARVRGAFDPYGVFETGRFLDAD